jgi:molybdate transport system substrate-binding protein
MRATIRLGFLIVGIVLLKTPGCGSGAQPDQSLTVFCGSANKPAMEEIAARYEQDKGIRVELIFGGSGTLLSQIELSRSGEIYLPGSPDYAAIALRRKQIIAGSDQIVAYLVPAIVTPAGNPKQIERLEDLTRPGLRLGIGNPETVCLGLYGVELLEHNHMFDQVLKNVVTFGASCSKTANLAAMSHVDAVVGWRVFERWNPERMQAVAIAADKIPRISYIPITIPVHTKSRELSADFVEYVLSPAGKSIYAKHGYITDVAQARELAPAARIGGEYELPADYFERIKNRWQDR